MDEQLESLQMLSTNQNILFFTSHANIISELNEWIECVDLSSLACFIFPKGDLFVFLTYICKEKWNKSQLQINQKHISLFKIDNEDNITGGVKFPVACLLSTLSITSPPFLVFFSLFSYK